MDNQTEDKWVEDIGQFDKGTGIFLIPDPTSEEDEPIQVIEVMDLTYDEFIRRGNFTLACKWVPDGVNVSTTCKDRRCVKTCVAEGCICYRGKCRHK